MSHRSLSRLAVALLSLTFALPAGLAQKKKANDQSQDPSQRERNVKPELKKAYKDWLEKDVAYIITDEERKAFKKLATDDERERFIEEFWRRRDPDPDTDENEFREEYYERIAYANEHFASGIPGWKTDRGRIWIMYGKPDETETHPSGGSYQREPQEGGGSTTTYPFERWFYRYLPGVGSGVEIEFVDPTGSGEYRIARNPDEKDALLTIPGAGLTLAEEMGLANKADRVANMGGVGMVGYMREQDSPFSRLQLLADLSRPPQIKFNDLASAVNTPVIEDNPLNFDVRVDFFRQSDERVITAFTIQTDNQNLVFKDSGGLQEAQLNIFGKITHVSGRRAGVFEDPVITRATTEELTEAKGRKSAYQKAVALAPGRYRVDIIVRDIASGATGVRHQGFEVPKYDPAKLSTSTLVLAVKLEGLGDQPAVGMFTIGNAKVIPNVSGTFHRGSPVGVYMQIYNAGIDQTTLRPAVDVEYALMKDGKELGKQLEDWRGNSDAGQRLTLSKLIDSRGLTPGDYNVEVRVRDHVSGQSLVQSAKFTILP
ncbi:MAG TPA: GWxTD domain-containing protein [Pyrinomonadaceae bacterium]|jgi:GWxTD domain-containing protein|nr:GWxTD domain-containing protein [Pyrinomonadaceae bacterium]